MAAYNRIFGASSNIVRYIILFLITTLSHADIYIQRVTSEQTGEGYMFRFVQDGIVHCWGMPDVLDPIFIPQTWTTVTQAAIDYNWPTMTGAAAEACLTGPRIPRTISTKAFTFNGSGALQQTTDVPIGYPCGDKISTYQLYHAIHYADQDMVGVCW
jgi:hypothetical protein